MDNFRRNKLKSGNRYIDNNLTIISRANRINRDWITEEITMLFLNLTKTIVPLKLLVKRDYLSLIKEFDGKNVIGLETNQWIYKKEEIDALISLGTEIIKKLNKKYH